MKILVCYKYVPEESEIKINADQSLDLSGAQWTISQYDNNAIEAAMKLADDGSSVEVLTVGGEALDNSKMRKSVLSRGPSKMYGVRCERCGDLYATAVLLKQAIERIGGCDLVIFGEGSGDMYSQILGNMTGALMGLPTLNGVCEIRNTGDGLIAKRRVGHRLETLQLATPAVISVTSDICRARIPSMKEILGAGKKPVEIWNDSEFAQADGRSEELSLLAPPKAKRLSICYKDSDEGLESFVQALRKHL